MARLDRVGRNARVLGRRWTFDLLDRSLVKRDSAAWVLVGRSVPDLMLPFDGRLVSAAGLEQSVEAVSCERTRPP